MTENTVENDQDTKPGEGETVAQAPADEAGSQDVTTTSMTAETTATADQADADEAAAKAEAEAAEKAAAAAREKAEAARKKKAPRPGEGETVLEGSNCSCEGADYVADKFGFVVVKSEHADLLCRDFGFKKV